MLVIAVYYVASDKILDIDKLQSLSIVNILGVVPRKGNKQRNSQKDASAADKGSRSKQQPMDRDDALAVTAQSIHATVLAKEIMEGSIALAGSIGTEVLQGVVNVFNQAVPDTRLRFVSAGDPMRDVVAVETISAAKAVVFVEKQGVSRCSDVVKENARVLAWGKPVLGAVLLDADAQ